MLLKERVMDPRMKDEISEALASVMAKTEDGSTSPAYLYHWYPNGLKERTVGPNSRKLVGMTRFYPMLDPRVVVDFEPQPKDGPFFEDEKRRFCTEQGIVYIPIYLLDKMDVGAFTARFEAERETMEAMGRTLSDEEDLKQHDVEGWMMDPALMALIDRHVYQLADAETAGRKVFGVARSHVLRRLKGEVLSDVRGQLRSQKLGDPIAYMQEKVDQYGVDPRGQSNEPAAPVEGRAD